MKISSTSPLDIKPTRASLADKTKVLLFLWLANLNNKSNVWKRISFLFCICFYRAQVAQFVENRAATREVVSSTPAGPTLRVFK